MARPWRRALGLALVVLASGCAGIPDSGPIRDEKALPLIAEADDVRVLAESAHAGQSAVEVVRGFLRAAASFDDGHAVARTYLDRRSASDWRTDVAVVYDDGPLLRVVQESADSRTAVVSLRARRVAALSAEGTWAPAPAGAVLTEDYRLVKRGDEWRITSPPRGLRLTPGDIERSFRGVSVFFLDPSRQVVVPDRRYLPIERRALSTALVRALLAGPSTTVARSVRTAVPAGTKLIGTAPMVDGIVTVDLSREVLDADRRGLTELSAQLVWTLRELGAEFAAVRLLAEGAPLHVNGAAVEQSASDWGQFDADEGAQQGYYRAGGRRLLDAKGAPVAGPLGTGSRLLASPALGANARFVAGLEAGRARLLAGPIASPRVVATAQAFLPPSVDHRDRVWTVASGADGQRLVVVDSGALTTVPSPLPRAGTTASAVSRDGTRLAVVSRGRLLVGRVESLSGTLRISSFSAVAPTLVAVGDISWAGGNDLVVVARAAAGAKPVPWFVSADGYRVQEVPVSGDGLASYREIAAGPGSAPLLAADGRAVYRYAGGRWLPIGIGDTPRYPG